MVHLSILLVTTSVTNPFLDAEWWRSSSSSCSRPSTTGTNGAGASPGTLFFIPCFRFEILIFGIRFPLLLTSMRTVQVHMQTRNGLLPYQSACRGLQVLRSQQGLRCVSEPVFPFMDAAVIISIIQSTTAHGS